MAGREGKVALRAFRKMFTSAGTFMERAAAAAAEAEEEAEEEEEEEATARAARFWASRVAARFLPMVAWWGGRLAGWWLVCKVGVCVMKREDEITCLI